MLGDADEGSAGRCCRMGGPAHGACRNEQRETARTVGGGPGGSGQRKNAAQKYVVAVVLVPLSHAIVTVQFRNCGTAGTILRSYFELAGNAKARLKLSAVYVHCDDTPLRSAM